MAGKQVTELDALPSFTDTSLLPVHNGAGLKKGKLSQLTDYMAERFSNPNLLINSNFKVNQRGQKTYTNKTTNPTYTLDRWMSINTEVVYNNDGTATITSLATEDTSAWFKQLLEDTIEGACTLSCEVTSVTGNVYLFSQAKGIKVKQGINKITLSDLRQASFELNQGASITLKWVKLEKGSIATPFVVPNPNEELQKCKAYYNKLNTVLYGYITSQIYIGSEMIACMRTKPTLKYTGSIWVYVWEKNFKYSLSSVGTIALTQYNEIIIAVSPVTIGQTCAVIFDTNSYIALDAEIYA